MGRGSLAGPVVVCVASFDRIPDSEWVRDSKRLTAKRRRETARWLRQVCRTWVIVEVWPELIDRINILEATRLAMFSGVRAVAGPRSEVVIDHVEIADPGCPVHSLVKADACFFSVAAASILAKVHRDRIMVELGGENDLWSWSKNAGYGTLQHRRAIGRHGRSYLHRQSFRLSPVLP